MLYQLLILVLTMMFFYSSAVGSEVLGGYKSLAGADRLSIMIVDQ
jgi:hypothetical protein